MLVSQGLDCTSVASSFPLHAMASAGGAASLGTPAVQRIRYSIRRWQRSVCERSGESARGIPSGVPLAGGTRVSLHSGRLGKSVLAQREKRALRDFAARLSASFLALAAVRAVFRDDRLAIRAALTASFWASAI